MSDESEKGYTEQLWICLHFPSPMVGNISVGKDRWSVLEVAELVDKDEYTRVDYVYLASARTWLDAEEKAKAQYAKSKL